MHSNFASGSVVVFVARIQMHKSQWGRSEKWENIDYLLGWSLSQLEEGKVENRDINMCQKQRRIFFSLQLFAKDITLSSFHIYLCLRLRGKLDQPFMLLLLYAAHSKYLKKTSFLILFFDLCYWLFLFCYISWPQQEKLVFRTKIELHFAYKLTLTIPFNHAPA